MWLMVALGGASGSLMRYGAGRLAVNYFGPSTVLDTLLVNVSGSFVLGLFMTISLERASIPPEVRALIAIGLLGGYTTFSTLSFEAVRLADSGELFRAGASILGNVALGLAAAYLGMVLARSAA